MSLLMDTMPVEVPVVVLVALAAGITVEGEPDVPVIVTVVRDTVAAFVDPVAEEIRVNVEEVDVLVSVLARVLLTVLVAVVSTVVPVNLLVGVLLTVLVTVLVFNVIELAKIGTVVVATVMVWLAVTRVEVKDVAVSLRMSEDVVMGVVVAVEATTVPVVALVSDIATLVDLGVSVEELGVPASVPAETLIIIITVLVTVLVSNVVELAELEIVVAATVMDWRAAPCVEVKDVSVKLRLFEVVVVGVMVVKGRQTPQVAPWQDIASTTKHQAPPMWPSGLQQ